MKGGLGAVSVLLWAIVTVPITAVFILVVASKELFRREPKHFWQGE